MICQTKKLPLLARIMNLDYLCGLVVKRLYFCSQYILSGDCDPLSNNGQWPHVDRGPTQSNPPMRRIGSNAVDEQVVRSRSISVVKLPMILSGKIPAWDYQLWPSNLSSGRLWSTVSRPVD